MFISSIYNLKPSSVTLTKATYIDLVAKGTVDEKIVKALRNKLNLAQEVLGDEKWKDWIS